MCRGHIAAWRRKGPFIINALVWLHRPHLLRIDFWRDQKNRHVFSTLWVAKESLKANCFLPHFSTVFVILTEPTPRTGPLGVRWSKPGLLKWNQGLKHFCTNLLILAKVSDEVIGPMFKPSSIVGMLDNNSLLKREDRNSRMYTVQIFHSFSCECSTHGWARWKKNFCKD